MAFWRSERRKCNELNSRVSLMYGRLMFTLAHLLISMLTRIRCIAAAHAWSYDVKTPREAGKLILLVGNNAAKL